MVKNKCGCEYDRTWWLGVYVYFAVRVSYIVSVLAWYAPIPELVKMWISNIYNLNQLMVEDRNIMIKSVRISESEDAPVLDITGSFCWHHNLISDSYSSFCKFIGTSEIYVEYESMRTMRFITLNNEWFLATKNGGELQISEVWGEIEFDQFPFEQIEFPEDDSDDLSDLSLDN